MNEGESHSGMILLPRSHDLGIMECTACHSENSQTDAPASSPAYAAQSQAHPAFPYLGAESQAGIVEVAEP